jgi:hypothetical protein
MGILLPKQSLKNLNTAERITLKLQIRARGCGNVNWFRPVQNVEWQALELEAFNLQFLYG